MTDGFIMLSTEFADFKYEPGTAYIEVWLHASEIPSEEIEGVQVTFTEEEMKDPVVMWCLLHAHEFAGGNRIALEKFVRKNLGDEFPFSTVLQILDILKSLLPYDEDYEYFYSPETKFFHCGSPVTIGSIDQQKLLEELKALSIKKEED